MNVRRTATWLAAVLGVLAGCGGGGGGGGGGPTPPQTASLTIQAPAGFSIIEVHTAPASSNSWGANLLTSAIPAGASRTITGIAVGVYDLRAVRSDGSVAENPSLALAAGGAATWSVPAPPPTTGSLQVVNSHSYPLTELYVSPVTDTTWGANQLSAPIPAGGSFTLTDIPPGDYDLKAVAQDGAFAEDFGVTITAGGLFTWTIAPPAPAVGSLQVVNHYSYPLTELYVSPATDPSWGVNQLSSPIPPGGTFTLTNVPVGSYDLRTVASDGAYAETYGVAIADGAVFTWTITAGGSLKVVNNYTFPLTELYVTPSIAPSWGSNRLSAPIPVGGSVTISGLPVDTYDFRVVASDGGWAETYGVAIAAGALYTWTLTP